jgi:uncharacterized tellurite resistance protein B-like protein
MGIFSAFNSNEKEKQRSHVKNLLELAAADGNLDEAELDTVIAIAEKFDMNRDEVMEIRNYPNKVKFNPPSGDTDKILLLQHLVEIMIADRNIDETEVKVCKDMAIKLNLSPVVVEEIVAHLVDRHKPTNLQ